MAQSERLINTLKRQLKAQGFTYVDVAKQLKLSQASVKRLFAEKHFTLQRLESVCDLLGMTLSELMELMHKRDHQVECLTREQEEDIASDMALLLVAVSVIHGFTFTDLLAHYRLTEPMAIQKLARLDRLKIIDLLPGNRIKLRVAPNFRWLPGGPIMQFFLQHIERDYFSSQFDGEDEKLLVINGLCSRSTNGAIQAKLEQFAIEVDQIIKQDAAVPIADKHGNTLVLALRQWNYTVFKDLRKA